MAGYQEIRRRMIELQDDGFYQLAEMIVDFEVAADEAADRISQLEKENEELDAEIGRLKERYGEDQ